MHQVVYSLDTTDPSQAQCATYGENCRSVLIPASHYSALLPVTYLLPITGTVNRPKARAFAVTWGIGLTFLYMFWHGAECRSGWTLL